MNGRTTRFGRKGIGALALALLAGTACAQQSQDKNQCKSDLSLNQSQGQQETYIPQLRHTELTILQKETDTNKTCTCVVDHGQIVCCQIDGQDVPLDRVQLKGDKVVILDENKSQKLAEIKVPQDTQRFTSGGYRGYNEQRFGSNEGRFQGQYPQDQSSRNYNTGQDSRFQQDQGCARGSYSQDTWRSQPYGQPYGQTEWQMRGDNSRTYSQPTYREDRFYTERPYPSDRYSSEQRFQSEPRDRYTFNEQRPEPRDRYEYRNYTTQPDRSYSTERYYPDRSYSGQRTYTTPSDQYTYERRTMGTTEGTYGSSRPMLGVMMSEADRTDLRNAGVDTGRFSQGVVIEQVNTGSPAEQAGLQRGDIIVAVDGNQPVTPELVRDTLVRKDFNETVRLLVIHNGQERNANVRLSRPDSMGNGRNYYTGETQWNHRMPQSVPPEPNAEFQPGNSNWRPGDYRSNWYYDQNTYTPR